MRPNHGKLRRIAGGPGHARRRRMLAWSFFATTCVVAIGLCLIATAPADASPADAAARRDAFAEIAAQEREMRAQSAEAFPTDPWSQDDAFHAMERQRAIAFAHRRGVRVGDVLDAVDEGLRGQALRGLVATVPPCRPRAIY